MAKKLTDFKTPTGQSGNIFSVGDWVSMILGGVVLIFTFAMAQNVAGFIGSSVPYADNTIDKPWGSNTPEPQENKGTRMEVL